jgi:putative ABC transport system ATP-binding protein
LNNQDQANNSKDPVIAAENVTKTYDSGRIKVTALNDVTLNVERGEMVAVMGPSGCGKTTLLNCLSGLDDITSGTVKINNTELSTMSDKVKTKYRAQRMGYIFQAFNLLPVLTARENVEMPLLVSGTAAKDAKESAENALELVGLTDWMEHYPAELSGGQIQRVTIARTPEIVWADEPTGNLDSENAKDVMKLMIKLNSENNQTFVIVTHSDEVAELTNRTIFMRDGVIESDSK